MGIVRDRGDCFLGYAGAVVGDGDPVLVDNDLDLRRNTSVFRRAKRIVDELFGYNQRPASGVVSGLFEF